MVSRTGPSSFPGLPRLACQGRAELAMILVLGLVDPLRDDLVSAGVGVLVDQGRSRGRLAHVVHEVSEGGAGLGGQDVAGVAWVVEVEIGHVEVAGPAVADSVGGAVAEGGGLRVDDGRAVRVLLDWRNAEGRGVRCRLPESISTNHAVLHLGATDRVPLSLVLAGAPVASCDTHVVLRVRPQVGLIKVRFFVQPESGGPDGTDPSFITIFDGPLNLPDGRIAIGDVEQLSRFVYLVGDRGEFKVRVAVDSPGSDARAVDVTIARSDV